MKVVLIFLFMVIGMLADAKSIEQNYKEYYNLCSQAQIEIANANWNKATSFYEEAFGKYFPFYDDAKLLLLCYKKNQQYEKHDSLVSWLAANGFYQKRESFLLVPEKPLIEEWQNEKPSYLAANYTPPIFAENLRDSDPNLSVFEIIESFIEVVRPQIEDIPDSQLSTLYAVSGFLFINRLKSGDFLPRTECNIWESERFLIAIIHIIPSLNENDIKELMNLLWQQVLLGNISATQYAVLYDSIPKHREKSIYGMCFNLKGFDQNNQVIYEFNPIQDIKNIDKKRESIFLPPLWVFAKLKNIELPKEYQIY